MKKIIKKIILIAFSIYFMIPILGTFLYGTSTKWEASLFPSDFTFSWFIELFNDGEFIQSVFNSLLLGVITSIIVLLVMVPTLILIRLYFPKLDKLLQSLTLLPYAIPGVILVTALLSTYRKLGVPMFIVLVGALFITLLPISYLGLNNQLKLMNIKELVDASTTLGASMTQTILKVIVPNLKLGITLVFIMVFSASFGEFMLTNLLIGGRFETIRIYMMRRMNENGHLASAVMILYFIFLVIVAISIFIITKKQEKTIKVSEEENIINKKEKLENVFNS